MTPHRLFNIALLIACVLFTAILMGAGGAYLDEYDRIKSMDQRKSRRDQQAEEFCAQNYGESEFRILTNGAIFCTPKGYRKGAK